MSFNILPYAIMLILVLLKSFFTKERLAQLKPSNAIMVCVGCYVICTTILDYVSDGFIYWYLLQFVTAISLISYAISPKKEFPSWRIGRRWFISIVFCLPVNVAWNWSGLMQPPSVFGLVLSVVHLVITLLVLPFYVSIRLVASALLVIFYAIYYIGTGQLLGSVVFLISMLGLSLMLFFIIYYNERQLADYRYHSDYLKSRIKERQTNHNNKAIQGLPYTPAWGRFVIVQRKRTLL